MQSDAQQLYREAFGPEQTTRPVRPVRWTLALSAIEKIAFPIAIVIMALFRSAEAVIVTAGAEIGFGVLVLVMVMRRRRRGRRSKNPRSRSLDMRCWQGEQEPGTVDGGAH